MDEVVFAPGLVFIASVAFMLALNVAAATLTVGLVAVLLEKCSRRASLPLRHGLACIAVLAMLASPVTVWLASQWNVGLVPMLVLEPCDDGDGYVSAGTDFDFVIEPTESGAPLPMTYLLDRATLPKASPTSEEEATTIDNAATNTVDLGLEFFNSPTNRSRIAVILSGAVTLFLLLWGIVGIWCAGRLLYGLFVVRRLRRSLREATDPRLLEAARQVSTRAGLSIPVRIAESPIATAPLTLGWWRPLIVVPTELAGVLRDEQLACIVAHELAHVRRRDTLIALVQQLAIVLFWWNPFLRIINREISRLRERLCDDFAALVCGGGTPLAEALVRAAEWSVARPVPSALTSGLLENGSDLEQRVKRLTDAVRPATTRLTFRSAGLLTGFGMLLCAVLLRPVLKAGDGDFHVEYGERDAPLDGRVERMVGEFKRQLAAPVPIHVSGQVLTVDKRPVAGATIYLLSFYGSKVHQSSDEPLAVTQTDGDGRYQFVDTLLPTIHYTDQGDAPYARFGTFQVCAEAEGFAIAWHGCRNHFPVPRSRDMDMDVDEEGNEVQTDFYLGEPIVMDISVRPARTLSGRVLDDQGQPVSGAEIQVCHLDTFDANGGGSALTSRLNSSDFSLLQQTPARLHQAQTGADGRFEIRGLPEGSVTYLTIEHSDFALQSLYAAISDQPIREIQPVSHRESHAPTVRTNPVEVRFRRTRRILVDVVHQLDESPAPGVTVSAAPSDGQSEAMSSGEADERGRAELKLPPGNYKIYLLPVNSSDDLRSIHDVTVEDQQDEQVVQLPIQKGCPLILEVIDADTGAGIPGVTFMEVTAEGRIQHPNFLTDDRGVCQAIVTPGTRWYGVEFAEGYPNLDSLGPRGKKQVECEAGKTARLQFRLKK